MSITISVEITAQRIADMFGSSFEHNDMTYSWCWGARLAGKLLGREHEFKTKEGYVWFWNPKLYEHPDFEMTIWEIEDESEPLQFGDDGKSDVPTGNVKVHTITLASIQNGLSLMASKYPHHMSDIIQEQDDAITADVFVQCVALGDLIYG